MPLSSLDDEFLVRLGLMLKDLQRLLSFNPSRHDRLCVLTSMSF
ncbi:MAG: hypothetical protein ACJA1I_000792 [Zhongshania marina]|jgi:hypothetical protein